MTMQTRRFTINRNLILDILELGMMTGSFALRGFQMTPKCVMCNSIKNGIA